MKNEMKDTQEPLENFQANLEMLNYNALEIVNMIKERDELIEKLKAELKQYKK